MQPKNSIEPMKIPDRGRHLDMEVFINRILNYRYHWHETKYEVTTVLRGRAIYSRGGEAVELGEDDLVVIEPLMGHASLALEKGTLTMTAYFDMAATAGLAEAGSILSFGTYRCDGTNRHEERFRLLRATVADIILSAIDTSPLARDALACHSGLLLPVLMANFGPTSRPDSRRGELSPISASAIVDFLEAHYMDKVSLEALAAYTGYNRTYLSTFFKTNTGLNFHDYLTRIRLKHSLSDLAYTDKQMTAIALDNGFPDLKTFTAVFKSNFHTTPSAYRQTVQGVEKAESVDSRILLDPHDPFVLAKLSCYSQRGLAAPPML